jgi:hypothetical protein
MSQGFDNSHVKWRRLGKSRLPWTRRRGRVNLNIQNTSPPHSHRQKAKMFKPFKPPLLKSVAKPASISPIDLTESDDEPVHRPYKKRKLLVHVVEDSPPPTKAPNASSAVLAPRKPLLVVKNPTELRPTYDAFAEGPEGYYMVLWYELNTLTMDNR